MWKEPTPLHTYYNMRSTVTPPASSSQYGAYVMLKLLRVCVCVCVFKYKHSQHWFSRASSAMEAFLQVCLQRSHINTNTSDLVCFWKLCLGHGVHSLLWYGVAVNVMSRDQNIVTFWFVFILIRMSAKMFILSMLSRRKSCSSSAFKRGANIPWTSPVLYVCLAPVMVIISINWELTCQIKKTI